MYLHPERSKPNMWKQGMYDFRNLDTIYILNNPSSMWRLIYYSTARKRRNAQNRHLFISQLAIIKKTYVLPYVFEYWFTCVTVFRFIILRWCFGIVVTYSRFLLIIVFTIYNYMCTKSPRSNKEVNKKSLAIIAVFLWLLKFESFLYR